MPKSTDLVPAKAVRSAITDCLLEARAQLLDIANHPDVADGLTPDQFAAVRAIIRRRVDEAIAEAFEQAKQIGK